MFEDMSRTKFIFQLRVQVKYSVEILVVPLALAHDLLIEVVQLLQYLVSNPC